MCQRDAPDLWFQQLANLQFQADGKQQQRDAEIGDLVQELAAFRARPVKRKPGQQKAHQWRQADLQGGHAQGKGNCNPDRVLVME